MSARRISRRCSSTGLGCTAHRVGGRSRPFGFVARPPTLTPVSARAPHLTAKLQGFGTTIFAEMSALAVATDSVNLGQGFPDTDGPREVLDAAIDAINGGLNQYPPGPGMPVLRQAIAAPPAALLRAARTTPTARCWSPPAPPRRWPARCSALLDTGDEVVRVRADVRQLRAVHRDGRRRRQAGHAAPAALRLRPRRAARGDHPEDEAHPVQHAAQPHRAGCSPATRCS